jgi:hypothetical protein
MDSFITIEEFKELKPIECPSRGGINFPCVICRECEIGTVMTTFEEDMLIETTVNSVLIHINLGIEERNDEIEKFALKRMKSSLSKEIPYLQKSSWDEGDVTLMIDDSVTSDQVNIQKIQYFINSFPKEWPRYAIGAKQAFSKWETQSTKEIAFNFNNKFNK